LGKREEIPLVNPSRSSSRSQNPSIQYGRNENNQRTSRKGSNIASSYSYSLQTISGLLEEKVEKSLSSRRGSEHLLLP